MQVLDFVKVYQAKSDEELIQLAAASEQLTFEARLALQGELCRRAISLAVNSEIGPQNMRGVSRSTPTEGSQPCNGESEGVGDFIADVLRVYHSHFWLFFKINAPAVIVTTIAIVTARNAGREIARQLPRVAFKTEILEIWLVNCSAWIISWMAFCVVFAATCIAVEESAAGFTASAWNSFLTIRERFNPFLRLSLLLMVLVLVMEATSGLFGIGVFWVLEHWRGTLQAFSSSGVIWTCGPDASNRVTVLSRSTSCYFGRLQSRASDVSQRHVNSREMVDACCAISEVLNWRLCCRHVPVLAGIFFSS